MKKQDMDEFKKIFKKVNGIQQLKEYAKGGVLIFALFQVLTQGFSKKSLEIVRLAVNNRIYKRLKKKNKKFIVDYLKKEKTKAKEKQHKKIIWMAWFQGIESAPNIVKMCYESIRENFPKWEIIIITDENYSKYTQFPDYIVEKYEKGIISKTHFSDLLRIELLSIHGGTWIDATVFCTSNSIPDYMMESELFLFQSLKPGLDGQCAAISSWFMTASANSRIINLTKALLYHYWEKSNKLVDYFLLHYFFQMSIETYPDEWNKVVPFSNSVPHILLLRLFDQYDKEMYQAVCNMSPFHKMSYKFTQEQLLKEGTYYQQIFEK